MTVREDQDISEILRQLRHPESYSTQEPPQAPLNVPVTLKLQSVSFHQAIDKLRTLTGVNISVVRVDRGSVPPDPNASVSIDLTDSTLRDALIAIVRQLPDWREGDPNLEELDGGVVITPSGALIDQQVPRVYDVHPLLEKARALSASAKDAVPVTPATAEQQAEDKLMLFVSEQTGYAWDVTEHKFEAPDIQLWRGRLIIRADPDTQRKVRRVLHRAQEVESFRPPDENQ